MVNSVGLTSLPCQMGIANFGKDRTHENLSPILAKVT
jgi:hypothetical protein